MSSVNNKGLISKTFNFNGNNVRTIKYNGKVWFYANDVASILGYSKAHLTRDVKRHTTSDNRKYFRYPILGELKLNIFHGHDHTPKLFINKPGEYQLAMHSHMPNALPFQHWISNTVLVSLDSTGVYSLNGSNVAKQMIQSPKGLMAIGRSFKELAIAKPKARAFDTMMSSQGLLTATDVAKDYGLSAKSLDDLLHKLGIIYKIGNTWHLYQQYTGRGLAAHPVEGGNKYYVYKPLKWTFKGQVFIYRLLAKHGIHMINEYKANKIENKIIGGYLND